jgi:hypothetical protein
MEIEPLLQRTIRLLPQTGDLTPAALREQVAANAALARAQGGRGPAGNSRLTATAAVVLLVLLAAECFTLIAFGSLLSAHVFIGMLLIPPIAVKLASTGYRFARYYLGGAAYRAAGPPQALLRMLGPVVIASTLVLFGSGVAMLVLGPSDGWVVSLHKVSFAVWLAAIALHVLGHVLRVPGLASADYRKSRAGRGGSLLRQSAVALALVAGLVLSVATLQYAAPWHAVLG